jgi:hypothetical protein
MKLTMMATMTTVATGDDDDDVTGDGTKGYEDDDDGNGQMTSMATGDNGYGDGRQ